MQSVSTTPLNSELLASSSGSSAAAPRLPRLRATPSVRPNEKTCGEQLYLHDPLLQLPFNLRDELLVAAVDVILRVEKPTADFNLGLSLMIDTQGNH